MEDYTDVLEIPVYLSQALAKNLYIYQFPLRPANRDWKDINIVNAAVKPMNQIVRLEVGLDTYSEKFCPSKGEKLAFDTDGQQESSRFTRDKDREKSMYFTSGIMDKVVYESTTACVDTKNYAVGIFQDKELHCTPIQGIVQLRPSLSYYDKQDKRKLDRNKGDDSNDDEEEVEVKQVTVKFARQETDVVKKAREKSYETISKRVADERWYNAAWKQSDSDQADLERLKLFSAVTSRGSALFLSKQDYLRALIPPTRDEADAAPVAATTVGEQIKDLLVNSKMLPFNDLRALVRARDVSTSERELVTALCTVACCVRGLWTARSMDLYTRASFVSPQAMCAARDHVLYLLTQHPYVDRRKVAAAVRLPPAEVLEVIRSVAKFNPQTGWELLLPPDTAFEAKYPDVIQRQNLYWEARQRQFNETLMGENVPRRQRKKSQRESVSSETMMSPKQKFDDDGDRKRPKNKSGVSKRIRNFSSSSAHDC